MSPPGQRASSFTRRIQKPIILLGSARSGTTMLGRLFENHPDVAYWVEPRPIWMHGNAYAASDELGAEDLSPRIARSIDKHFWRFMRDAGKTRFAEKTPSNCLRVPFIHALYPDCRIINIIRDGRAVVRSTIQIQSAPPNKGLVLEKLKQTPLTDWPAYFGLFFRTVWRTKVLKKRSAYWGPRPRQWRDWMGLRPHVLAAKQWRALVERSIEHGRALPTENYLEIRYEELVHEPERIARRMLTFCDLSLDETFIENAKSHVKPDSLHRWKDELTGSTLEESVREMAPLLTDLGYE